MLESQRAPQSESDPSDAYTPLTAVSVYRGQKMMGTSRSGVNSIAITKSEIASSDRQKFMPTPSSHLSFGDRLEAV